jgi:hypothetical protein
MSHSTFIHSGIVNPAKPNITVNESADAVDTVTLDVPLLTRILELAREEVKSDEDLHLVITNILAIKNKGVLTMQDYDAILKKQDQLESIRKLAGL